MGQRPTAARLRRPSASRHRAPAEPKTIEASIFATPLGWIGVAGCQKTVVALTIGHASAEEVRSALGARVSDVGKTKADNSLEERNWYPELRRALERYAQGQLVDLRPFKIDLGFTTPYRKRVLETARRIPYGKTLSYGELAARSGKPRAARAVGSAMASNPIALLVPCHRVVAAGGAIGGFSCRSGVELKQRLLEMEAQGARGRSHGTPAGRLL
ncbi:MAG TPA: methylated-DNA--[protein]-cysteine S-methyltransferase [Planctomycetaceae bacterium]|jgi:methylated-DNA-[protein]-cysteine S-methyltransferase|nr:methylated-DNA--[protein]-cysteine S-methyltransferase [Planctomycetaceae bacterium]